MVTTTDLKGSLIYERLVNSPLKGVIKDGATLISFANGKTEYIKFDDVITFL